MCYFKDTPVAPSQLDPEQLQKVSAFRSSIGQEGGLYWTFSSLDHFENLIRLHLARQVQAFLGGKGTHAQLTTTEKTAASSLTAKATPIEDDDEGVLDLMDIFEDRLEELTSVSSRIGRATKDFGENLTARSVEITHTKANTKGDVSRNVAKRLIGKAASDMDQYVVRMDAEIPAFSKAVSEGLNALVKAMALSIDSEIDDSTPEEIETALAAVRDMRASISTSHDSLDNFRAIVLGLPRLTSVLNKSKRAVAEVLDRLLVEFQTADSLAIEAETIIKKAAVQHGKESGR